MKEKLVRWKFYFDKDKERAVAQRDGSERLEHEELFSRTLHLRTNTAGRILLSGGTAATECEGKGRISALPGA